MFSFYDVTSIEGKYADFFKGWESLDVPLVCGEFLGLKCNVKGMVSLFRVALEIYIFLKGQIECG
jgi:hypothetical protein